MYENSRRILRRLPCNYNVTQLAQELKVIAADPVKLGELMSALDGLDSHSRVFGLSEVVINVDGDR
jgi:hypothetical protein